MTKISLLGTPMKKSSAVEAIIEATAVHLAMKKAVLEAVRLNLPPIREGQSRFISNEELEKILAEKKHND